MRKLVYGLAALPLLTGLALAAPPLALDERQMDAVTAGLDNPSAPAGILSQTALVSDARQELLRYLGPGGGDGSLFSGIFTFLGGTPPTAPTVCHCACNCPNLSAITH